MKFERTCVACRKKADKSQFIKVVFNKNGEVFVDEEKKSEGRGAYVCNNADCIKKCVKLKAFSRSFRKPVSQEFYEKLLEQYSKE